jgi:hypothetical protein
VPIEMYDIIDENIIGSRRFDTSYLNQWIETMRDANRLSNSILLNLSNVVGEVDFGDFLRLEILKLNTPSVYRTLYNGSKIFLKPELIRDDVIYTLTTSDDDPTKPRLEKFIHADKLQFPYSIEQIVALMDLVQRLFPFKPTDVFKASSHLSIVYLNKFERYFAYCLAHGNLSEIVFSNARKLGAKEIYKVLEKSVDDGFDNEVRERLFSITYFENQEDFELIIGSFFYLSNYRLSKNPQVRISLSLDIKKLLERLDNSGGQVRKYYDTDYEAKFRSFILRLFESAKAPYYFESYVLKKILEDTVGHYGLERYEFENIVVGYLKDYIEGNGFDRDALMLYDCCHRINEINNGGGSFTRTRKMLDSANSILRNYADLHLESFLIGIISYDPARENLYAVNKLASSIFKDWNEFELFLNRKRGKQGYEFVKEFFDFFIKFKSTKFRNYVPFEFKVITIKKNS